MTAVKYEEKYYFEEGHVWLLMDDDWGVEIIGENGFGGHTVLMGGWDFTTREAWVQWGDICAAKLQQFSSNPHEDARINTARIYDIHKDMPKHIEDALVTD